MKSLSQKASNKSMKRQRLAMNLSLFSMVTMENAKAGHTLYLEMKAAMKFLIMAFVTGLMIGQMNGSKSTAIRSYAK